MLWSGPDREFWQVSSATDEAPWGRSVCGPKPEQGLKRGHRSLAAIVPKGEFVKIDLQVLAADAVIRADEPLLKVADCAVWPAARPTARRGATRSGRVACGARA